MKVSGTGWNPWWCLKSRVVSGVEGGSLEESVMVARNGGTLTVVAPKRCGYNQPFRGGHHVRLFTEAEVHGNDLYAERSTYTYSMVRFCPPFLQQIPPGFQAAIIASSKIANSQIWVWWPAGAGVDVGQSPWIHP